MINTSFDNNTSLVWFLACPRDPRRIHSTDVVAQKGNPLYRHYAGNLEEPYGHVIHPADGVMNKANRDKASIDSTNDTKVAVSSSGANGDDDDDDDSWRRKIHNGGCGGDESLPGDSDNDHDDELCTLPLFHSCALCFDLYRST